MSSDVNVYTTAADLVAGGWTRKKFEIVDDKGIHYCLVGAVLKATHNSVRLTTRLPNSVREEINSVLRYYPFFWIAFVLSGVAERLPLFKRWQYAGWAAELWNDAPWRRQKTVISVLRILVYRHPTEYIEPDREEEYRFR